MIQMNIIHTDPQQHSATLSNTPKILRTTPTFHSTFKIFGAGLRNLAPAHRTLTPFSTFFGPRQPRVVVLQQNVKNNTWDILAQTET